MSDHYYIGTGEKNCYYTLRYTFTETHQTRSEDGKGELYTVTRDYHIRNLSINRDEAIAKAREITGKDLGATFEVREIGECQDIDWSVLQGGKHVGKSIHEVRELPDGVGYLCWLAENCEKSKMYAKTVELLKALLASELGSRADEREEKKQAEAQAAAERAAKLAPIAEVLKNCPGGFCESIVKDISFGIAPRGRAIGIVRDIFAKAHGRRNSKAYNAAYEVASEILTGEAEVNDFIPRLGSEAHRQWNIRHGHNEEALA